MSFPGLLYRWRWFLGLAGAAGVGYLVLKPAQAKALPLAPPPVPSLPKVPVPAGPPSLAEKLTIKAGDIVTVNLMFVTPDFDFFKPPSAELAKKLEEVGRRALAGGSSRVLVKNAHVFPDVPPESRMSWDGTMLDPPQIDLSFAQQSVLNIERKV